MVVVPRIVTPSGILRAVSCPSAVMNIKITIPPFVPLQHKQPFHQRVLIIVKPKTTRQAKNIIIVFNYLAVTPRALYHKHLDNIWQSRPGARVNPPSRPASCPDAAPPPGLFERRFREFSFLKVISPGFWLFILTVVIKLASPGVRLYIWQ